MLDKPKLNKPTVFNQGCHQAMTKSAELYLLPKILFLKNLNPWNIHGRVAALNNTFATCTD